MSALAAALARVNVLAGEHGSLDADDPSYFTDNRESYRRIAELTSIDFDELSALSDRAARQTLVQIAEARDGVDAIALLTAVVTHATLAGALAEREAAG